MRIFKRILLYTLIIIFTGYLFRGFIYRITVVYKAVEVRANYTIFEKDLIDYIDNPIKAEKTDVEEIIDLSLTLTSKHLRFSTSRNSQDPNKLVYTKTANCIGYATFFSTICNYLIEKHNVKEWKAVSYKGQLYFLGINVHQYFDSPFFKDHDFVIIQNKKTGQTLAVDPSVNDYLDIKYVTTDYK